MKHLKSEFDKLSFREFLAFLLAVLLMISAIVCIFLSMFIEPEGEIHESVLFYYSISAASASTLLGVTMYYDSKTRTIKSEILSSLTSLFPHNPAYDNETHGSDLGNPQTPLSGPDSGLHLQRPSGG